jgi:HSP20 family protein
MAANPNTGMTSVGRRPAEGYMPLRQAFDRLFQESFWLPSLLGNENSNYGWPSAGMAGTNFWEASEGYVLQVALPGMQPGSIDCTVEQNVLTLKAQSAVEAPANATPIWQTFGGQASFRIQLPAEVEAGQAQATYENGILTLSLPKAAHARTRQIKVTAK